MKKNILIFISFLLPTIAFAQLKVNSSGNVLIGDESNMSGTGKIKIYHSATSLSCPGIKMDVNGFSGMKIANTYETSVTSMGRGLKLESNVNTTSTYMGIEGRSENLSTGQGNSIGVRGVGKVNGTGAAYGVLGCLTSNKGAGVFGASAVSYGDPSIIGKYAGYFSGNVKVTGTIDGTLVNSSDARLKENVQALTESENVRSGNVLDQLDMLTPVSFNYKKMDDGAEKQTYTDEDGKEIEVEEQPNPVMEHEHFGLIAQELQQVYPNLVYEQDNGYLAVNYVELVPVLMQAIKELNAKVESLEANRTSRSPLHQEAGIVDGSDEATSVDSSLSMEAGPSLSQNVPNPFSEKTDIDIYLPESVETATLYIYDLSGKQLEQHPIAGRGHTVMTIHADRMDAGMYVYSLIADKKVVMTKKMIVTK